MGFFLGAVKMELRRVSDMCQDGGGRVTWSAALAVWRTKKVLLV